MHQLPQRGQIELSTRLCRWPLFALRELGAGLFQLNYVLEEPDRLTRRTTLWRRHPEGWRIVFHQGTVMAP